MAATVNSVRPRTPKFEIEVTAAIKAALSSLFPTTTPPETLDLSPMLKGVQMGDVTRNIEKEFVAGAPTDPILDYDPRIEHGPVTVTILYTNGKETLGTDGVDPLTFLQAIVNHTAADLSLPCYYSAAGGAVGDEEYVSSPTKTFVEKITPPSADVGGSGKIQVSFVVNSATWTAATVA